MRNHAIRNKQTHQVVTAPDRCTKYLISTVEDVLAETPAGDAIEVQCSDGEMQVDLASWCLSSGHQIRNPFAHYLDHTLLIERVDSGLQETVKRSSSLNPAAGSLSNQQLPTPRRTI